MHPTGLLWGLGGLIPVMDLAPWLPPNRRPKNVSCHSGALRKDRRTVCVQVEMSHAWLEMHKNLEFRGQPWMEVIR